jgi:cytochrome c oxidase cbb3-type subunit 2
MNKRFSFYNLEASAIITFAGIVLLFSGAVIVTLIAPAFVDPSWTEPTSSYQVQMYEVADPNIYISSSERQAGDLQFVYHLKKHYTLLAFQESPFVRIVAPPELERYITKSDELPLKLSAELLLLRRPQANGDGKDGFDGYSAAEILRKQLQEQAAQGANRGGLKLDYEIYELYRPEGVEAFAAAPADLTVENWVDRDFIIVDAEPYQPWHRPTGVIYVQNPREYRIKRYTFADQEHWKYDPAGERIASLAELQSHPLGFTSRQQLIRDGEKLFATEGCWYCHTDQTRTLIQDVVLNGSAEFPAPPSSANEYIYQNISFAGTRRIGPDVSRVGIKRPSRDWHKSHFWSPKTASAGSIMPAFQHFFDFDPRGTSKLMPGIPNHQFEAVFQYLMTKGTRITPPTQAWWLGLDPLNTKAIIEGRKVLE